MRPAMWPLAWHPRHHRFGLRKLASRQHHRELVSADAKTAIDARTHGLSYRRSQLLQHPVALLVSIAIVDLLEVIEIEIDQAQGMP